MAVVCFVVNEISLDQKLSERFNTTPFFHIGEQPFQTGGESLDDCTVLEDDDPKSPTQGRRNRREACTCPFCKDGEARYAFEPFMVVLKEG